MVVDDRFVSSAVRVGEDLCKWMICQSGLCFGITRSSTKRVCVPKACGRRTTNKSQKICFIFGLKRNAKIWLILTVSAAIDISSEFGKFERLWCL